jgi:hypothetical protein
MRAATEYDIVVLAHTYENMLRYHASWIMTRDVLHLQVDAR